MTGTALMIVAGSLAATAFNPFKARKKARMVQAMNGARQVTLAMHAFAQDYDGLFPSEETAKLHGLPKGGKWSNDYFRQLLAGGIIPSEQVFWVKSAKVCNRDQPDDIIETDGKFDPSVALQAGDCGWAYVSGQSNASHAARPLVIDAYTPGTTEFDAKIWDGKVLVGWVDGAVLAVDLDAKGALVVNGEGVLDAKSAIWKDSGQDPVKLLLQPEPAKQEAAPGKNGDAGEEAPAKTE